MVLKPTAGCSWAYLNGPWGNPVPKCHPSGIAAYPVLVPVATHYVFVAPDKPLSRTDGEEIFGNAKWDTCCQQYLDLLCNGFSCHKGASSGSHEGQQPNSHWFQWVLTGNPVTGAGVQLCKIFCHYWNEWQAEGMPSCEFIDKTRPVTISRNGKAKTYPLPACESHTDNQCREPHPELTTTPAWCISGNCRVVLFAKF